jgi:phosphoglycolate phosphatase-like HAD superfamily hydrolase
MDKAVIFDVDGVLLQLTAAEEELFFEPFERRYGLTGLSRDWDSYKIRNDEKIVEEIFERHGLPPHEQPLLIEEYLSLLHEHGLPSPAIDGALGLLENLSGQARLGIATANFREAARVRLDAAGMWGFVSACAFGADGSGHKHETVAKAVAATGLPCTSIVYVGDNLNDLEAGMCNGVHFIAFSRDEARRRILADAGAVHVCGAHHQTLALIKSLLRLD